MAVLLSESSYNSHRLLWDLFTEQSRRCFVYREEIAREQLGTNRGVRGEPIYYMVSSVRPSTDKPLFYVETKEYRPGLKEGDQLGFNLRANPVITQKVERDNPKKYLEARRHRKVKNQEKLTKKRVRHDVVMNCQKEFLTTLCHEFNLQSHLPAHPQKRELKKVLLTFGNSLLDDRLTAILKDSYVYGERLDQSPILRDKLEWAIKAMTDEALQEWMIKQGERHGFKVARDDNQQLKLQNSGYLWHSIKAGKGKNSGFSSVDFTGNLIITNVETFRKALFEGIGPAKSFGCGLMLVRRL
ncbi:CRISPR system CASCADE complex protein CasE [delta proteobacterium NaphS2]|nr:CRISPR system CASCADE complex protein CasE [delta proteobacterium NaphS2]